VLVYVAMITLALPPLRNALSDPKLTTRRFAQGAINAIEARRALPSNEPLQPTSEAFEAMTR
jgi:HEAT repeat protein